MQRRLIQNKVYSSDFYSVWKAASLKPLKKVFETFISCDKWKKLFFIQIYRYLEVFYDRRVIAFFETSALKEVRYFHNNITMLPIRKVHNKAFTS